MSDLMLIGVLRMPMDDPSPLDVLQYVGRGRQAADRIEADAAEIERLRAEVAGLREDHDALLQFAKHVRRYGDTGIASMAIAVLAARKGEA